MSLYEKPDYYSKLAQKEGYKARSVYKLKEINEKTGCLKPGQIICDLGCAPGSWLQYVSHIVGMEGKVVGIDYKEIKVTAPNIIEVKGNFQREKTQEKLSEYAPFDGVISDMAPDTTGDKDSDAYKSSQLVEDAFAFARKHLKEGGFFIAKIFQGGDEKEVFEYLRSFFTKIKWMKPAACRKKSVEIFIVGLEFRDAPDEGDQAESPEEGFMPW